MEEIDPDFCVVTEHSVKAHEIDRINFNNYNIIAHYTRETARKGGVLICSKNNIKNVKTLDLPSAKQLYEDKQFEFCSLKCKLNNFEFILVGLYRSPSSKVKEFLERLNSLIEIMLKKCKYLIIAGDVNINVLVDSNEHFELKNILKRNGLAYLVNFPTRIAKHSESAIDNVFTNISSDSIKVSGLITLLSDHDGQLIDLKNVGKLVKNKKQVVECKRSFSTENVRTFLSFLEKESWIDVYLASPETKYEIFYQIYKYYFDLSFHIKRVKIGCRKNDWLTEELKREKGKIIRDLKNVRRLKRKELYSVIRQRYKQYKKKLTKCKKEYYDSKIAESSNVARTTWGVINFEVGNKTQIKHDISLKLNGVHYSDPKNVSNIFCDYFSNIACSVKNNLNVSLQKQEVDLNKDRLFNRTFRLTPTDEQEVEKVISLLKNKNSVGFDEIPISILKTTKKQVSKVLSHLINSSFVAGIFPKLLKISKIVPIYKNGCTKEVANYRPISVLSNVSKIFERVIYNRLLEYLEENHLINNIQHGFRSNKSVTTAAISFIESVIESVDRGEETIGIFMDLTKAFDCVEHSLLLNKLFHLGIKGTSLKLFESYLKGRKQFVEMKHIMPSQETVKVRSNIQQVKYGVPQGSILGPILFLCYINNISETIFEESNTECLSLYADDSNLKVSANSIEQLEANANSKMDSIYKFFNNCNLFLNTKKTKLIKFSTKQSRKIEKPNILVNSSPIDQVNEANFLGLKIDRFLSWEEHIKHIIRKINSGIYALKQMAFLSNSNTLKSVYHAHIQSHIHFGISLYGSTAKSNLDKLLTLQKKGIRIILNLKQKESVKTSFKNLGILTVYGLYIYECICIFKNAPLINLSSLHPYNTRGRSNIISNQHCLAFYNKKPSFMGRKFLHCLPTYIKNEKDIRLFKKNLKSYILNLCLYSLEEYFMETKCTN